MTIPSGAIASTAFALLASFALPCAAQPALRGPTERERTICAEVVRIFQREHLRVAPMGHALQTATLDTFVGQLDPRKLYFTEDDIESIRQKAERLDQQLHDGDLSLAYHVVELFQRRVKRRVAEANKLLDAGLGLTADEVIDLDFNSRSWSTADDLAARWRKSIEYDLLAARLPGDTPQTVERRLKDRYRRVQRDAEQMDDEDLLEMFLTAVARSYDPHSAYMSEKTVERFNQ